MEERTLVMEIDPDPNSAEEVGRSIPYILLADICTCEKNNSFPDTNICNICDRRIMLPDLTKFRRKYCTCTETYIDVTHDIFYMCKTCFGLQFNVLIDNGCTERVRQFWLHQINNIIRRTLNLWIKSSWADKEIVLNHWNPFFVTPFQE